MPLLSSKKKQLVLYNRSGIAAPFVVKMERYQAYDPHKQAKRMGKVTRGLGQMFFFGKMETVPRTGGKKRLGIFRDTVPYETQYFFHCQASPSHGSRSAATSTSLAARC